MTSTSSEIIAFAWIAHFVIFLLLATSVAVIASRKSGSPLYWPVGLRWELALFFALWSAIAVDTFVIRMGWGPSDSMRTVILRWIPVPLGIAMGFRISTRGLSLDREENKNGSDTKSDDSSGESEPAQHKDSTWSASVYNNTRDG